MTIEPNKVTALIGSSGCGKSTFLRSLNRMHEVIRGRARRGRRSCSTGRTSTRRTSTRSLVRRKVGMVFQAPNPFPTMSIYDNVAAGLKLNRPRDEQARHGRGRRAVAARRRTSGRRSRTGSASRASGLSGGQQQRLCIARAIAVEPEVLLMDEPASALDPIATLAIEELVHQLKKDYTIVIVTHNMQQASRASDFTAFFNLEATGMPGHLVEMDTTEKIFTTPSREDDRGLHQRPLRLDRGQGARHRRAGHACWNGLRGAGR